MKTYEIKNPPKWPESEWHQCDVCSFWIDPAVTPSGGRHHGPSTVLTTDSVTGRTFYDLAANDAGQGCPACGSPAWRLGGKGGDLMKGGW